MKEQDIENGIMGHEYYLRLRQELLGEDYTPDEIRPDGSIYIGDGVWLTVDGEYKSEGK